MRGSPRLRTGTVGAVALLALLLPTAVLAAAIKVDSIPGNGWIQSPDNTAGMAAEIVNGPNGGLGGESVEVTTEATTDFTGIARQVLGPLGGLTGASLMTHVLGDTVDQASEPATLRFAMYRLGGTSEFTTMTVDAGAQTPNVWQTTTLGPTSQVWQTNETGGFCIITDPCDFTAFKAQYPDAILLGLTVAIGTGTPAHTSYFDGVSVTTARNGARTWNFELAAANTPRPTVRPNPTTPPTDVAGIATTTRPADGLAAILLILGSALVIGALATRRPSRRDR